MTGSTGPCPGIPTGAAAISLDITVTRAQGSSFIMIHPQGGAVPAVSTLNYNAGQTIGNAAIVPMSATGGATVVAGVSGTGLILGIFSASPPCSGVPVIPWSHPTLARREIVSVAMEGPGR